MRLSGGRVIAYLVLIALGILGLAPFLYLLVLSFKRRIEILAQVPPTLKFQWATIVRTYTEVLYGQDLGSNYQAQGLKLSKHFK